IWKGPSRRELNKARSKAQTWGILVYYRRRKASLVRTIGKGGRQDAGDYKNYGRGWSNGRTENLRRAQGAPSALSLCRTINKASVVAVVKLPANTASGTPWPAILAAIVAQTARRAT